MVQVELDAGRKPGTVLGMKYRQCPLRIMKNLHLCSLSLCLPGFSTKEWPGGKRERNMILAATWNRYELDQVEQAMKIQFPDDEVRNNDDRIGKYHNNILGGAVNEDDDLCQEMKKSERTMRRILMHWPRHHKKKQKLWHPWPQQTEHSLMLARNSMRYGCHVFTFLSKRYSVIVPTGDRNESAAFAATHAGLHNQEKQGEPGEKKGEATTHTAYESHKEDVVHFCKWKKTTE